MYIKSVWVQVCALGTFCLQKPWKSVKGGCEPPDEAAGDRPQVLWKSNIWSSPLSNFFRPHFYISINPVIIRLLFISFNIQVHKYFKC